MRIMLVDDHTLFLEGLQYVLETNGIQVIGIASNGLDALDKARVLKPDVILMDIRMPGLSGLDALRLIKAEMPEINIIMLTISEEDNDLFEAVKYGASGYLLKNTDVKALTQMLTDIENGEASLSRELAFKLLKEFKHEGKVGLKRHDEETKTDSLTRRQLEVLEMVAKGATYKEVGEALGLTERTVKYHMGRIIELLHLENRTQVIAYAVRTGLVYGKKLRHLSK
jgi:two-component system NarL family response regulator